MYYYNIFSLNHHTVYESCKNKKFGELRLIDDNFEFKLFTNATSGQMTISTNNGFPHIVINSWNFHSSFYNS